MKHMGFDFEIEFTLKDGTVVNNITWVLLANGTVAMRMPDGTIAEPGAIIMNIKARDKKLSQEITDDEKFWRELGL